jgi:hypothetical protein
MPSGLCAFHVFERANTLHVQLPFLCKWDRIAFVKPKKHLVTRLEKRGLWRLLYMRFAASEVCMHVSADIPASKAGGIKASVDMKDYP